ncbi:MAG: hypothetical protein ABWY16_12625 [Pedobacter sp.]|uniref:hypothetical protein n=1 Tax=Pedobacter sp. TaxID=1411316 RepID=UPI00339642A8
MKTQTEEIGKYERDTTLTAGNNPALDKLEREREILLALSNDITRVRDKDDLILIFSSRIKSLFFFNHQLLL